MAAAGEGHQFESWKTPIIFPQNILEIVGTLQRTVIL